MSARRKLWFSLSFACWLLGVGAYCFGQGFPFPGPGVAGGGKTLTFVSSEKQDAAAGCSGAVCTYFTSGAIGTAVSSRRVHAAPFANTTSITLTSATICGQTATINKQQQSNGGSVSVAVLTANVTTGTTCAGGIVVTWGNSPSRTGVGVWYSTGLTSDAASSTAGSNNCTTCSASVTALAGGFVIGVAGENTTFTPTWTNVTQQYSDAYSGSNGQQTGAHATSTSAGALSVQVQTLSSGPAALAAAAF